MDGGNSGSACRNDAKPQSLRFPTEKRRTALACAMGKFAHLSASKGTYRIKALVGFRAGWGTGIGRKRCVAKLRVTSCRSLARSGVRGPKATTRVRLSVPQGDGLPLRRHGAIKAIGRRLYLNAFSIVGTRRASLLRRPREIRSQTPRSQCSTKTRVSTMTTCKFGFA